MAEVELAGKEAVRDEIIASDRPKIGIGCSDVDFDKGGVGEFLAGIGERARRTVNPDIGDLLKPAIADMREQLSGAAAEVA